MTARAIALSILGALVALGATGLAVAQDTAQDDGPNGAQGGAQNDGLAPIAEGSGFAWLRGDDAVPATVERSSVKQGIRGKADPRDAIPPIDAPAFYASHEEAETHLDLQPTDRVLGVVVGDDARAYPVRILDRHEIVNDTIGGLHLAVVW